MYEILLWVVRICIYLIALKAIIGIHWPWEKCVCCGRKWKDIHKEEVTDPIEKAKAWDKLYEYTKTQTPVSGIPGDKIMYLKVELKKRMDLLRDDRRDF